MSAEGVAFLVVLVAVGAVPGTAAVIACRASSRRVEARLNDILALLRSRQARRPVGYEFPAKTDRGPGAS